MKIINIPKITGIICTSIILNMINLSFARDNERTSHTDVQQYRSGINSHLGYKPVLDECPNLEDTEMQHNNFLYKEWCKETFTNGNFIYDGYKDIAFNIKYTPEAKRTDNWQTPIETSSFLEGDCEDAVFLFFSHLPPTQKNANIVWGWVIDREDGIARAHVWYQLEDKNGKEYVVEGFSNDWNGIIPMEIVNKTETRKPILKITHLEASRLLAIISRPDCWSTYKALANSHKPINSVKIENSTNFISQDSFARYHLDAKRIVNKSMSRKYISSWSQPFSQRVNTVVSNEISKLFRKMHELFTRYERQITDRNANLHAVNSKINYYKGNLNCRR